MGLGLEGALRLYFGRDDLQISVRSDWGSLAVDHRRQIREAIRGLTGEDHSDLEKPPVSQTYSLSVSHTPTAGGFASVLQPLFIGFDVEETTRIQNTVVARVSSKDEIAEAPSPAALWGAKESAFKALTSLGYWQVLRDVSICDWAPTQIADAESAYAFRVSTPRTVHASAQGLVFSRDTLTFAIFIAEFETTPQLRSGTSDK